MVMPVASRRKKSSLPLKLLTSCFGSCFGRKRSSLEKRCRIGKGKATPECLDSRDKNEAVYKISLSFRQALYEEGLLIPKCTFNPNGNVILRICYGFETIELTSPRDIYHSYSESRWDSVIDKPRCRMMSELVYPTDPLVDGIPASVWIDCVEPSLVALVALNKLKRRRTNLSVKTQVGVRQSNSNSNVIHGDYEVDPDDAVVIGPHGPPAGYVRPIPTIPTDEVRPSIWIFHDVPADQLPQGFKTFVQCTRGQPVRHRRRFTKRSTHHIKDDPGAAAFPNLTLDDMPRSDDEDDTDSDEDDDIGDDNEVRDDPREDHSQQEISIHALLLQ